MSNLIVNKQDEISTLSASEWNQFAEINNLISSAGITADANVLNQVAKSVANYSNASNFFTENGTVNNYVLIASGSFLAPTSYINGMVIRFITTNANTTTTPIVNLAGLGAKNIKKADGTSVIAGDIAGYVELRYNGTDFLLSTYLASKIGFWATLTVNQNIGDAITTKINLNSTSFNYGSYFNTATGRFTPLVAGKYLIGYGVQGQDAGVAAQGLFAFLYKNGGEIKQIALPLYDNGNARLSDTIILDMNGSTDYIELYALISGAGANTIAGGTNDTFMYATRLFN